jgi:hypothetical protein
MTPRESHSRAESYRERGAAISIAKRTPDAEARRIAIAHGYTPDPSIAYPGTNAKWPGHCNTCGGPVTPYLGALKGGAGPCKQCGSAAGGLKRRKAREDEAIATMIRNGLRPTTPYPGADKPWPSVCTTCGGEVAPLFSNVRKRPGGGCIHCKASNQSKALRQPDPEARADAHKLGWKPDPDIPFPGAHARWPGTCSKSQH